MIKYKSIPMPKLEEQAKALQKELKSLIDEIGVKYLFGERRIVERMKTLDSVLDAMEWTDPCPECEGEGVVDHECDCEHCEVEEDECENCFGDGRIDKKPRKI